MKLSIIIPAFNEELRLPSTLEAAERFLLQQGYEAEVIIVDDGSTDATGQRAQDWIGRSGLAAQLVQRSHQGKGAAVRAGMLLARGSYCMICDADLAMSFEQIPRFFESVDAGAQLVIGSRQIAGAKRLDESWHRHLLGLAFNQLVRWVAVPGIQDTQCGYKLFERELAQRVFAQCTVRGFAFDVEALVISKFCGAQIHEIPIQWRQNSDSRVSPLLHSLPMLFSVLKIGFKRLFRLYRDA